MVRTQYVQKREEEDKKKFQVENKVKNKVFSSCPNFVFALYTLISPNLQIILKKKNTYLGRSQGGTPILKIAKNMALNPVNGIVTETQKTPFVF